MTQKASSASPNPESPYILALDVGTSSTRTLLHDAAVELREQLDEAAIHARTGARFHASYWPAKLRWLATQAPDTFSRVAQWLSFGEYLYRHFLGRSVCSLSMASVQACCRRMLAPGIRN